MLFFQANAHCTPVAHDPYHKLTQDVAYSPGFGHQMLFFLAVPFIGLLSSDRGLVEKYAGMNEKVRYRLASRACRDLKVLESRAIPTRSTTRVAFF